MQRGGSLKTNDNKTIILYRKLLDVMEQEKNFIAERNLEGVEHCFSLKAGMLKQLDELKEGGPSDLSVAESEELKTLIEKLLLINKANAESVRAMKDVMSNDISSLHKSKAASRAYNLPK
jgi:hypothetical protein